MSSGFVSAGTTIPDSDSSAPAPSTDAWAAAKAVIEETKKPKEEELEEERSLFAILQANKAKKQEEFEEKLKFKNQFKPLDEDDVEYLDSILTNERRAEEARRHELEAQLDAFRQHQSEVDRGDAPVEAAETTAEFGTWEAGGRKRRKKDEGGKTRKTGFGVKIRRTSSTPKTGEKKEEKIATEVKVQSTEKKVVPIEEKKKEQPKLPIPPAGGLMGLVAYGSDDDD